MGRALFMLGECLHEVAVLGIEGTEQVRKQ